MNKKNLTDFSDGQLVKLAQEHDASGVFAELARRHYDFCLGRARAILSEPSDAEDAVHDAWVKAFLHLNQLTNTDKFAGWLDRIVVSSCIDTLRRNQATNTRIESNEVDEVYSGVVSLDEWAMRRESQAAVRDAVKMLPVKYQEPLRRHHFKGESYKRIAKIMNMPLGTVQSHINRARKRLEIILKPHTRTPLPGF